MSNKTPKKKKSEKAVESALKIVDIALGAIRPYWRNAAANDDKRVPVIVSSIKQYGFTNPIIVDEKYVIIAGHARYKALQKLGWEKAPCIISTMTEKQAKQYRIADNKAGEIREWNEADLIKELKEISDMPAMQVFFPTVNLEEWLTPVEGHKKITALNVEVAQENLNDMAEDSMKGQAAMVTVTCPHCGEDFIVDTNELNRKVAKTAEDKK